MTTTNTPARASTAPELAKFRADGQGSLLGLAIQHATSVYTARVNQTFTTETVAQLTYDGGSGTLANVLEGMTVYVGSAAGLSDRLVTRVRKTPTATILYIPEVAIGALAENDYITIFNEFQLWPRDLTNAGGIVSMDYDVAFGDLTRGGIIPRIGPMVAVVNQTSGTLTFTPPNPSLSAGYDGATVASYLFAAPGSSTSANLTSATTASWTYPLTANQEYRWSVAITDSLGRVTTSYRWVFVNPTEIPFTLEGCSASFDDGDWMIEVTNYADVSAIHPRALVSLYSRDYYGGVIGSIGKLTGYENILATGWIDGESIEFDSEKGTVSFTVRGAAQWMDRLHSYPIELVDTAATETAWSTVFEMTVDKALARLLYWTSTAPLVMDLFFTGSTDRVNILAQAGDTLLSQVTAMADKIFAKALVNSYGQMYISVDQQIIDTTARAALPVVMDITTADYETPLSIDRNTTNKTSLVELSANQSFDGVAEFPIFARAPASVGAAHGGMSAYESYTVTDPDECKRIAGCLYAVENNLYEPIDITLPSNNRLFDIALQMWATITTASTTNPRGVALTAKRLIPRNVAYSFEDGAIKTGVTFEVEAVGIDGVEYFPPTVQDENLDTDIPDFGDLDFPGLDLDFPPTVPPTIDTPCNIFSYNSYSLNFSPNVLTGAGTTLISSAYFPCKIRTTGTYITLNYQTYGDASAHVALYAVNSGTRVLTGSWSGNTVTFSPASDTAITGFEIEIDAGAGTSFTVGALVSTGAVAGTNETGITIPVTSGVYYGLESYGGPIQPDTSEPSRLSYMYQANSSGRIGYNNFWWEAVTYGTDLPTGFLAFEDVDGLHGRVFFLAAASSITYRVYDNPAGQWYNNAGSLSYALRYAYGRQIKIGAGTLHNVCTL